MLSTNVNAKKSLFSPEASRVLGNTGWLMADRICRMGLGLGIGVWLARYLGPAEFGILSFATSFVAMFGTFTSLGLDGLVVRNITLSHASAPETLGTAFVLRLLGSVIALVLVIATCHFVTEIDRTTSVMVSVLSVGLLFQVFDVIDSYFQSQVQSKFTVLAKNLAFLIAALAKALLIFFRKPVWTFAIAQVLEMALGAMGLLLAYRLTGGRLSVWRARRARGIELLAQSWPIILSGVAITVYMRIDMIMLKLMQGDTAVGIYATATRVSEVWYFVPMAIVSSVTPALIRCKDDLNTYYRRLGRLFSFMSLLAIVVGSGIALCSHWIIHVLFGETYINAAPVLAIHIWASIFVFMGVAQAPWDTSENLFKLALYRTLSGALSNVVLNLVLIPKYSAMGAAIATVLSYAISAVIANAFHARTRPIFKLQMRAMLLMDLWHPATASR